jgi:hypothetical protein
MLANFTSTNSRLLSHHPDPSPDSFATQASGLFVLAHTGSTSFRNSGFILNFGTVQIEAAIVSFGKLLWPASHLTVRTRAFLTLFFEQAYSL